MAFWGGILFLGIVVKTWQNFTSSRDQALVPGKKAQGLLAPTSKLKHMVSTYVTTPALFEPSSKHHVQLFWGFTLPTRLDFIIIFLFWAVIIVISCVDYQSFSGNIRFKNPFTINTPSIFQQNWQYSADRTGIVSYACLPWIWLFAGRKNIFLWATPFDFNPNADSYSWTWYDYYIGDIMSGYWANFIKTGNPNIGGSFKNGVLPYWPANNGAGQFVHHVGDKFGGISIAEQDQVEFIKEYFAQQTPH
ncbi:ferric reductase transmembrane component 4 precursor protein [Rutstroemia sp. NJR-2017a WRK4]|nr:ferric reductase transmembrane component 4 precursor protein [Rutstroemia sp. NJR-2017a WRK4]